MVRWSSLGTSLQEMVDMKQGHHMLVVASELGLPNIVDSHAQNLFTAALLGQITQRVLLQRFRGGVRALRWQAPPLRSSRITQRNLQA